MTSLNRAIFSMQLHSRFFFLVSMGKKTVEGRVFNPKYASLRLGGTIRMAEANCAGNFVDVHVTKLTQYSSFRDMLEKEGVENCLPGTTCIEEGVKIYYSFPTYQVGEAKYGVLAIGIKVNNLSSTIMAK